MPLHFSAEGLWWQRGLCLEAEGRRGLGCLNLTAGFYVVLRKIAGWGQDLGLKMGGRKTSSWIDITDNTRARAVWVWGSVPWWVG